MGVGVVHPWLPPVSCKNVASPSNLVVVMISIIAIALQSINQASNHSRISKHPTTAHLATVQASYCSAILKTELQMK